MVEACRAYRGGRHEVRPLRLDVTDDAQIAALSEALPERLDAIANNAGIVVSGPLETLSADEVREQFGVTDTDLWRNAPQTLEAEAAAMSASTASSTTGTWRECAQRRDAGTGDGRRQRPPHRHADPEALSFFVRARRAGPGGPPAPRSGRRRMLASSAASCALF